MHMRRAGFRQYLCAAIGLLWLSSVAALTPAEKLDRDLPRIMKSQKMPGLSALVIRAGTIRWQRHLGFADLEQQQTVTADTLFMLASVSKTVTAVAMMALVDDGAVTLDEPIDAYLPFTVRNPRFPDTPITFRMLLTHTSSINDAASVYDNYYTQGDSPIPLEDFLAGYFTPGSDYYDPDNFLNAAPGKKYRYSNEGTALLGLLVQRMSGQSFEDFCANRIFLPLGMIDTAWRLAALDASRVALPYAFKRGKGYVSYGHYGYPDIPNGALRTTATQLAKFLMMFMNGGSYNGHTVLQPATVTEMTAAQIPGIDPAQGLIWYHQRIRQHAMIGHDGGDDGVSTAMFYEPATGTGIIVLANGNKGADAVLKRILLDAQAL